MFRTGSPYSPFFTSGLLSEPSCTASSSRSRSPSPEPPLHLGVRRGSLPTDSPQTRTPSADESSAFYFTLQPKRDQSEFRSFLSLDLAESQSLRSASLKRKTSISSRAVSGSSRPGKQSISIFPQIPEVPSRLSPPATSLRYRLSRDSMRAIPSPKPAPSITLPDVPKEQQPLPSPPSSASTSTPPRLPSIAINPTLSLSLEPASQSAPSLVISRATAPPAAYPLIHRLSTTSSVSTRVRRINRSAALARLEGRSKSADLPAFKPMVQTSARNFMSMSDDEDADSDFFDLGNSERITLSIPLEPEDVVLPALAPMRMQASKSAPLAGRFPSLLSPTPPTSPRRKQRRLTKDWFPLKSFIDLQNDEDASRWSWRSFIEVASVS